MYVYFIFISWYNQINKWEVIGMDFERRYDSIEEVLDVAKSAEGKLVKEYDVTNRLESKKIREA